MDDYYELLGIHPDATTNEIRRAYKRKIREVHPDRPGGDGEHARLLEQARSLLLDPVARAQYDARRFRHGLFDETLDALTEVGERAVNRLGATVQARGHDLLGALRDRAKGAFRPRRRK